MRRICFLAVAAAVLAGGAPAAVADNHDTDKYVFGLGVGVLGNEIEGAYHVNDNWSLRVAGSYSSYEMPGFLALASGLAGVPYDYDLRLATFGLLADYHLLGSTRGGNALILTGGLLYNGNRFDLVATPFGNLTIGGTSYTPAQIGTLTADIDLDRTFAPYFGIGVESNFFTGVPVTFYARFGLLFQGRFDARLAASGGGVSAPDLATEAVELEDALGFLQTLPVASIGIRFRF